MSNLTWPSNFYILCICPDILDNNHFLSDDWLQETCKQTDHCVHCSLVMCWKCCNKKEGWQWVLVQQKLSFIVRELISVVNSRSNRGNEGPFWKLFCTRKIHGHNTYHFKAESVYDKNNPVVVTFWRSVFYMTLLKRGTVVYWERQNNSLVKKSFYSTSM